MASNGFSAVIDFAVNMKSDPKQIQKIAQEAENLLKSINPEIDFNDKNVKKNIQDMTAFLMEAENSAESLSKVLSAMDIDLNTEDAKKAMEEIEKAVKEINNIDFDKLNKTFDELATQDIDRTIGKLEDSLKNLDTSAFDDSVDKLAISFMQAQKETQELINKQKAALQALKSSGKEGTDAYKKLSAEIDNSEQKLSKMGLTAEKSGKSLGDRMATFGLAAQGIEQITGTLSQFQQPFIELDKQVRNIGTLGVKNFKDFADASIDLSKTVPDSAGQIAEGIYDAISAGTVRVVNGQADIAGGMKFVETASKLAAAGLTTTKDSVNGLTSVMNAYKISAGDANKVADMFFGTVNVGKTTIPELNASLANVIPNAAAMGVEFEEIGGALATMTKQGVPTTQATTKLNQALVELQKPGAALAPILKSAGITMESIKTEGLQTTLKKLGVELEKTGKTATQVFGSVDAASAVMLLSGENAEMAALDYEAVKNSIGATDAAFGIASEGIEAKTKVLMNKVQAGFNGVMNVIGSAGQTALAATTQLAPMITSFAGLGQIIPVDKLKSSLSTVKSMFSGVGENASGLTKTISSVTSKLTGEAGILSKLGPMMMNPWVIGGAAATAALTLFFTKTERGKEILGKLGEVGETILKKLEPIGNALVDLFGDALEYLGALGEMIYEIVITPIELLFSIISSGVQVFAELTGSTIDSVNGFDLFAQIIKVIGLSISQAATGIGMFTDIIKNTKDVVISFISSIPELFSVLLDYAKYYLNPANWISGDADYEKALSDRLSGAINGAMNKAKGEIAKNNIDKTIKDAVAIKGDLDEGNQINALVAKFNAAKDEVEKASIAEQIKKVAPEAVQATGVIVDSNGKLVNTYKLLTDKITDSSKANKDRLSGDMSKKQKEFIDTVLMEADAYTQNKARLKELQNQISEKKKMGVDTSDLEKEFNKLSGNNKKIEAQMLEMAKKWEDAGLDATEIYTAIGKVTGKNKDEVKKTADEQKKLTNEANKTADAVKSIGDAYNEAKAALQGDFKKSLDESLGYLKQIREAKAKGDKASLEAAQKGLAESRAKAKEADKELDSINAIEESEQKRYENAKGLTALQKADNTYSDTKKQLELNLKQFALDQETLRLKKGREKTSYDELLLQQKSIEAAEKELSEFEKIYKVAKNADGKVVFGIKMNPDEKKKYLADYEDLKQSVQDSANKGIETRNKIILDETELKKKIAEYDRQVLEWQIELGIKNRTELIAEMTKELEAIDSELRKKQTSKIEIEAVIANSDGEIDPNLLSQLSALDSSIVELQGKRLGKQKEIFSQTDTQYSENLSKIQAAADKETNIVNEKFDKEISALQRFNDRWNESVAKMADKDKSAALDSLDAQKEEEIKRLDELKELGVESTETAERKKAEIEESYRQKRADAEDLFRKQQLMKEAFTDGQSLEANRKHELKLAEIQKQSAQKEMDLINQRAKEKGVYAPEDAKRLDELQGLFKKANDDIEKNSGVLNKSLDIAGQGVRDGIASLFAGDNQGALDALRKMFSNIFGMMAEALKTKVKAAILDMVISWLGSADAAALPFLAKFALLPVMYGVTEGAINAIASPIINELASFATGGRVDSPTNAVIGDASKLGMPNREWIFNDPQLIHLVRSNSLGANSAVINAIERTNHLLATQRLETRLIGTEIRIMQRRTAGKLSRRAR